MSHCLSKSIINIGSFQVTLLKACAILLLGTGDATRVEDCMQCAVIWPVFLIMALGGEGGEGFQKIRNESGCILSEHMGGGSQSHLDMEVLSGNLHLASWDQMET